MFRGQDAGRSNSMKLITVQLKGWKRSQIWVQPQQINILFSNKLRED